MQGDKIILPQTLWDTAFSKAHQSGHPGINSLKRHIHSHFWFPQLTAFIESTVKQCHLCQMFSSKITKEPIQPVHTSNCPWDNVSVALLRYLNLKYLKKYFYKARLNLII